MGARLDAIIRFGRPRLLLALLGAACASSCRDDGPVAPEFPAPSSPPTLEEKLARQWDHFEHATKALVEHVGLHNRALSREQWEQLLLPAEPYRLNPIELETLGRSQRERIDAARELSRERSSLDLDRLRRLGQIEAFCRELPKGGLLHVHPNGMLDRDTVGRMLRSADPRIVPDAWLDSLTRAGASFYRGEVEFLESYSQPLPYSALRPDDQRRLAELFHLPAGTHDFERFAAMFRLLALVRAGADQFPESLIYEDFFQRARRQGVFYVEFTHSFQPTQAALAEWQRRAEAAGQEWGIVMRLNFAFQRTRPASRNARILDQLLGLDLPPVLVGVDLLGPEAGHPGFEAAHIVYARLLIGEDGKQPVLHRTLHAAGLGDAANIRDAIILGADRIGHATALGDDPIVLEYGARRAMPIEVNLTSNFRLRYIASYEAHPFLDLLRLGYRVSLSTDDEGMLDTDISREFALAIEHTDITFDEIRRLCFNSIETAFVEPEVKAELLTRLAGEFESFEQRWALRLKRAD